ncbi:MAG: hypothetical protein R3335_08090 [Anaerolineales bacterium]|nr:hypothetical protein [Anaerolineales bacterium]
MVESPGGKLLRWEYLTLRVFQGEVVGINGRDAGQGGKKRPRFPDYLNVLGQEGWEVIYYGPEPPGPTGGRSAELLLKRRLP